MRSLKLWRKKLLVSTYHIHAVLYVYYCNILLPIARLQILFSTLAQQIAGHTTEFVREVLQEVARGNKSGGLILLDAQRS